MVTRNSNDDDAGRRFHQKTVDGMPYIYEYEYETILPIENSNAFDILLKELWVGGGFPPGKISVVIKNEGIGRGREGSVRNVLGGVVQEKILVSSSPGSSTTSILYTILTMPLPFHDYMGYVQFIPQDNKETLFKWNGKLAPKSWDLKWFHGFFCWLVYVLFKYVVGFMVTGFNVHVRRIVKSQ